MREPAIALAARSVLRGDYPAQSASFCDNKKQTVGISLLCEVFFFMIYLPAPRGIRLPLWVVFFILKVNHPRSLSHSS